MSIKKEPSGRRSVELEFEVPGTPEDVWQAIATGPGISSWFVPARFEEQDGKPVAVTLEFGPGMDSRSTVTAFEPLKRFTREAAGWVPGSPPLATEFILETRAGGKCVLRIVQSLFASTDDWDGQLTGAEEGWPGIVRVLRIYLEHFRGRRASIMQVMVPVAGTRADGWSTLSRALALGGVTAGARWDAPAGAPALGGTVEFVAEHPVGVLLRADAPYPATATFFMIEFGKTVMAAMTCYIYADGAADLVARETPRWQAWITERFTPGAA